MKEGLWVGEEVAEEGRGWERQDLMFAAKRTLHREVGEFEIIFWE